MGFIQAKHFTNGTASINATFTSPVTAGSTLVVAIAADLNGTATVSDNVNGSWTSIGTNSGTPGGLRSRSFCFQNSAAGTITVTVAMTSANLWAEMMEIGGTTPVSFDQTAGAQGTSTAPNSGNAPSTSQTQEFLFAMYLRDSNTAISDDGSGWTFPLSGQDTILEIGYRTVSPVGTYAASATLAASIGWYAGLRTFKLIGGVGPLTLFCNNPIQGGSNAGLLDTTAPTASTSTTGWTVGTSPPNRYSRQTYNSKILATNFTSTVQPSGAPTGSAQDCWRLSAATTGVFSAGTWYSSVSVIAVTAAGQRGAALFRLWRSTNADGTSATEITNSRMTGTTLASNLLTTAAQSSSASTFLSAVTLNNEFLFFQVAWSSTTTATSASADVVIRLGNMAQGSGSGLITSVFSAFPSGGGGGPTPNGQYYYSLMADWFNR